MTQRGMRKEQTLFEHVRRQHEDENAPLAARMRPRTLQEYVGQRHLLGEGHVLERAIRTGQVPSMVLWGPPGTGKTTLARLVAGLTKSHFIGVSAVTSGVADLRQAVEEAREIRATEDLGTILFVDEVHRFNKAQQDAILPHVENGTVTFIGATTENPSFEVISALLSRTRVLTLKPLSDDEIAHVVRHALADTERGLGNEPEATFSTCFGAPFLPRHPTVYARLLGEKIARYGATCWLVNTGWSGGAFGVGERMKIAHTRAMLRAAIEGRLASVAVAPDPNFGVLVPQNVPDVPNEVLSPRNTWSDKGGYDTAARGLAQRFEANFEQFEDAVDDEVKAAAIRAAA